MNTTRTLIILLSLATACAAPDASQAPDSRAEDGTPPPVALPTLTDMDGQRIDLGATAAAGKSTAFVFWQTWCASCIREAPELARIARLRSDSVQFVGVIPGPDDDVDEDEVRRLVAKFDLPYPQVRDRDLVLSDRFEVKGTPTIVVLDPTGVVRYVGNEPPEVWPEASGSAGPSSN
jgi:thiol-disulfide isomerase/thioredoxin